VGLVVLALLLHVLAWAIGGSCQQQRKLRQGFLQPPPMQMPQMLLVAVLLGLPAVVHWSGCLAGTGQTVWMVLAAMLSSCCAAIAVYTLLIVHILGTAEDALLGPDEPDTPATTLVGNAQGYAGQGVGSSLDGRFSAPGGAVHLDPIHRMAKWPDIGQPVGEGVVEIAAVYSAGSRKGACSPWTPCVTPFQEAANAGAAAAAAAADEDEVAAAAAAISSSSSSCRQQVEDTLLQHQVRLQQQHRRQSAYLSMSWKSLGTVELQQQLQQLQQQQQELRAVAAAPAAAELATSLPQQQQQQLQQGGPLGEADEGPGGSSSSAGGGRQYAYSSNVTGLRVHPGSSSVTSVNGFFEDVTDVDVEELQRQHILQVRLRVLVCMTTLLRMLPAMYKMQSPGSCKLRSLSNTAFRFHTTLCIPNSNCTAWCLVRLQEIREAQRRAQLRRRLRKQRIKPDAVLPPRPLPPDSGQPLPPQLLAAALNAGVLQPPSGAAAGSRGGNGLDLLLPAAPNPYADDLGLGLRLGYKVGPDGVAAARAGVVRARPAGGGDCAGWAQAIGLLQGCGGCDLNELTVGRLQYMARWGPLLWDVVGGVGMADVQQEQQLLQSSRPGLIVANVVFAVLVGVCCALLGTIGPGLGVQEPQLWVVAVLQLGWLVYVFGVNPFADASGLIWEALLATGHTLLAFCGVLCIWDHAQSQQDPSRSKMSPKVSLTAVCVLAGMVLLLCVVQCARLVVLCVSVWHAWMYGARRPRRVVPSAAGYLG
jgi:hypothetical protein